jgi:hypothetical protein
MHYFVNLIILFDDFLQNLWEGEHEGEIGFKSCMQCFDLNCDDDQV